MNKGLSLLLNLACVLALTSCQGITPAVIGEATRDAEEALCPLTTAQNIDTVLTNIIRILPFFNDWQPVCSEG